MASADAWHGQWRWTPHRPAASVRLTTPLPGGRPGLVSLGAAWERQAYRQSPTTTSHERRRADVSLSDWASGMLRWQLGLALDRFDTRRTLAASAGIDRRWHDDRIALLLSAEGWTAGFANGRSLVAVRTAAEDVPRWSARAGLAAASRTAPLALWPRAGIDRAFVATARAHPARTDDIMQADSLGRQLAFASVEYARPIVAVPGRQVSLASFLDAVVIAGHQTARRPLTHLDVGVGLRVPVPEVGGVLGLDVAWGTQDGRVRLSAAVRRAWPGR
jgi:hypothetical protein